MVRWSSDGVLRCSKMFPLSSDFVSRCSEYALQSSEIASRSLFVSERSFQVSPRSLKRVPRGPKWLSDFRSVSAESEICFKTHRFGSAELNSIREELLNVSLDFKCSNLKL